LSRFYEGWLPLALLITLIIQSPSYAILAVVHLLLFRNGLSLLVDELPFVRARWQAGNS
jgi:hypothetical protein